MKKGPPGKRGNAAGKTFIKKLNSSIDFLQNQELNRKTRNKKRG